MSDPDASFHSPPSSGAASVLSRYLVLGLAAAATAPAALAAGTGHGPLGHAPIAVMGDHVHHEGEWMLSYRYMFMHMDGNIDGTDAVPVSDIIGGPDAPFLVAPTEMDMQMHMLGLMYAPSDRVTVMAMLPYIQLEMTHDTRMGTTFTTETEGPGDLRVSAGVRLLESDDLGAHLNLGLSFPSGSIDEADVTPMSGGSKTRLPFPMQTGSGTFDFLPGITVVSRPFERLSLGSQLAGTVRMGRNDIGYRLGHRLELQTWSGQQTTSWLGTSLRLGVSHWGDVRGDDDAQRVASPPDPDLAGSFIVPTADPTRRGGTRLDGGVGINLLAGDWAGPLAGPRLAVEAVMPLYAELDGPQLETDWTVVVGWQKAF